MVVSSEQMNANAHCSPGCSRCCFVLREESCAVHTLSVGHLPARTGSPGASRTGSRISPAEPLKTFHEPFAGGYGLACRLAGALVAPFQPLGRVVTIVGFVAQDHGYGW